MTREEQLRYCRRCLNREFDPEQGYICGLTGKVADFQDSCKDFDPDEELEEEIMTENNVDEEDVSALEIVGKLTEEDLDKLRQHQDFSYAIAGGLLAVFFGAILWAIITVLTAYQYGFMALVIGFFVGFAVQYFGAGIDRKFGYLGAFLSLICCLLGSLFTQVGFAANEISIGYFKALTYLSFGQWISVMVESFSFVDLFFYGIAVYTGYRFAFRRVSYNTIKQLQFDSYEGLPLYYKLRLPLVIISIAIISFAGYKISRGYSGIETFYYESGQKMSEGNMINSKEDGEWNYWYESGLLESTGFYTNGVADSLWTWYYETGDLMGTGNYEAGLEHGTWIYYHQNGLKSDSGSFDKGRKTGFWKYWYDNGYLSEEGYYKRDRPDGFWRSYYENGQLESEGRIEEGYLSGTWKFYFDNGQVASVNEFKAENESFIREAWDPEGNQIVKDGYGIYRNYSEDGQIITEGRIEAGVKVRKWTTYFENGSIKEEGIYEKDVYKVINYWDYEGNQIVTDGNGLYVDYYADNRSVAAEGKIEDGLREGVWKFYFEGTGIVSQESEYSSGAMTGTQNSYYQNGMLFCSGSMLNDQQDGQWNWYYEDGTPMSLVNFNEGQKYGKQIFWDEFGEKTKEEYYEDGVLVEERLVMAE